MLTVRAYAYLALAYAFIFLSLLLRASWLTVFVVPPALLLVFSIKMPRLNTGEISVTRQIQPARSIGDEDVNVILTVTNRSNRNLGPMSIEDQIPADLEMGAGTNGFTLSLSRGENVRFEYQITKPKRGNYTVGPTLLRLTDSLGLRTVDLQPLGTDELIVLPRIEKLGIVDLKGRRFGPWPGLVSSGRMGMGSEFFEISPYVPGDDLRRVNWKASARSGVLVTNAFEAEQVIDVLVVLDCSEVVGPGLFDYDALEFEVSFAASLCAQLIAQGNRVGLSVYGTMRTWVSPGFGKRHLLRLLDSLALVRSGTSALPMNYVVGSIVATILPARSLVILISPLMNDEVLEMADALGIQGYNAVCFTPSASTETLQMSQSTRMARRIFSAERALRIARARRIVEVIQLSPKVSVKPLLRMRSRWVQA